MPLACPVPSFRISQGKRPRLQLHQPLFRSLEERCCGRERGMLSFCLLHCSNCSFKASLAQQDPSHNLLKPSTQIRYYPSGKPQVALWVIYRQKLRKLLKPLARIPFHKFRGKNDLNRYKAGFSNPVENPLNSKPSHFPLVNSHRSEGNKGI